MKRLCFRLPGLAVITALGASSQTQPSLTGAWQVTELTLPGKGVARIKPGPNLTIFSAKHYSRVEIHSQQPRPALANEASATADELRAVWGPVVAESGTYEVSGGLIIVRPVVSKNPRAMAPGASLTYAYKLEANTLTLTANTDQNGPVKNPFTVTLKRID